MEKISFIFHHVTQRLIVSLILAEHLVHGPAGHMGGRDNIAAPAWESPQRPGEEH